MKEIIASMSKQNHVNDIMYHKIKNFPKKLLDSVSSTLTVDTQSPVADHTVFTHQIFKAAFVLLDRF